MAGLKELITKCYNQFSSNEEDKVLRAKILGEVMRGVAIQAAAAKTAAAFLKNTGILLSKAKQTRSPSPLITGVFKAFSEKNDIETRKKILGEIFYGLGYEVGKKAEAKDFLDGIRAKITTTINDDAT
jgi:hypothetical protein